MTRFVLPIVTVLLVLAGSLHAAEGDNTAYAPVGAPADPKVNVAWNRYHDYGQTTTILKQLAEAHPRYFRLTSLGESYGGHEMWLITMTDFQAGDADGKPAFWIDGGIHANEIQGTEAVLYTAWFLAEMAEQNDFVRQLLTDRTFYMVPMMNPDGREVHFHQPATTHTPRGGIRPYDDDRDGLRDEDDNNDLDGDGHITQMRIADPNGPWKPHDKYPQLMVRIERGENPDQRYRLLGYEGFDNDGDGQVDEDPLGGYDPNRDWPWQWQPDYAQHGAVKYPLWVQENRLAADFVMAHPNIAGAQSYHNAGGMILRGPSVKGEKLVGADESVFDELGRIGEKLLPGYRYLHMAEDLYPGYGVELAWFYGMRGTVAFTNELFTAFNFFREKVEGGFFGPAEDQRAFNEFLLLGEGVVPWHEVEHPEFGTIEVGGLKKSWLRQPPSFLLQEELHRNMAFTLQHADALPLVRIQSTTFGSLDDDVWQVTAVVENQRLTPTRLAVDVKRNITRPDQVSISGEDLRVIAALRSDEPFFKTPAEQEHHPAQVHVPTIDGHDVVYVRWIVEGQPPFTITVDSVKGGHDSALIDPAKDVQP